MNLLAARCALRCTAFFCLLLGLCANNHANSLVDEKLQQGIEIISCPSALFNAKHPRNFLGDAIDQSEHARCARIEVKGERRYFIYELPSDYDPKRAKAYPLVFGWHGCWDSAGGARYGYQLTQNATEALISVYPHSRFEGDNGSLDAEDSGSNMCWNPFGNSSVNLDFFDHLNAAMRAGFHVDSNRIFSVGFSSGAFMSNQLACTRSSVINGVVAISGGLPVDCQAPVSAYLAHGVDDPRISISHFDEVRRHYANANACSAVETPVFPTTSHNNPDQRCYARHCDKGVLEYCLSDCPLMDASSPDYKNCVRRSGHRFGTWQWFLGYGVEGLLRQPAQYGNSGK